MYSYDTFVLLVKNKGKRGLFVFIFCLFFLCELSFFICNSIVPLFYKKPGLRVKKQTAGYTVGDGFSLNLK
jgi:hypothetical protein